MVSKKKNVSITQMWLFIPYCDITKQFNWLNLVAPDDVKQSLKNRIAVKGHRFKVPAEAEKSEN